MRHQAIVIAGPTGSGKTPLGHALESKGWRGRACAHFDFGARLRTIADRGHPDFSAADRAFINDVLSAGTLLEKEHFALAQAVFNAFIRDKRPAHDGVLALNGFPRHPDQAGFVERLVDVRQVLHLVCAPEVVCSRIRLNCGGDRNGRSDDTPREIEKKLDLFQSRTFPMLDYYRAKNIPVNEYQVSVNSTADEIRSWLEAEGYKKESPGY